MAARIILQAGNMLTLYHGRTSVCAIKARIALAEKGLEWTGKLLTLRGDQFDPEYMKLNPNAVVPTLVHDGKVVIESSVILYYLDDAFPDPALMPRGPYERARVYLANKLIDEYVHTACMTITFATVNRAAMAKMGSEALEKDLARSPDPKRAAIKRQVAEMGLDAPPVVEALRHHRRLLERMDDALASGPYLAGGAYSNADIGVTPYIWRLQQLRLSRMWDRHPAVAAWYERIQARPSFKAAIGDVLTREDRDRYANFEPDPWPRVNELMAKL
jgi:glutathione S-transferase